jgi:mRNA-degrading endonuclease RelE of RelBE toxin-antitoxin system
MPEAKAFRIELATSADRDLQEIPIQAQRKILSEIQLRLKAEPFREIKTRIKRLTGTVPPVCRLGIGVYRTYYRIVDERAIVLAILHKKDNERWLGRFL